MEILKTRIFFKYQTFDFFNLEKVVFARITFFKLNEFKQLVAQKKELDPPSVRRLISISFVN